MDRLYRKQSRRSVALVEALEPRTLLSYTFTTVTTFRATTTGNPPTGMIMDSAGDIFGVDIGGGAKGYGAVVELVAGSGTLTVLASFTGKNGIGLAPRGQLVLENGNLYGITTGGGAFNKGTIFEVANIGQGTASTITTLVSFNGTNGSYPIAGLVADANGNLLGTTYGANHTGYASTVFQYSLSTSTLTVLAKLKGTDEPNGTLAIDASGDIFGTTTNGGSHSLGSVFEISGSAHTLTTVFSFNGTNGSRPSGQLLLNSQGNLIGLTAAGGANGDGTLFQLPITSSTLTTLATFNGTNGQRPLGNLILDSAGDIFGATSVGGGNSVGTIYERPAGTANTLTRLYSFSGQSTGYNPIGALVMDAAGNLWGETYFGGPANTGTLFELKNNATVSASPALVQAAAVPAPQLVITRQPATIASGAAFSLVIKLEDASGNVLSSNAKITLNLASGPTGGTFAGTRTVSFIKGVATFSSLDLRGKGTYTLAALSGSLQLVTSKIIVT